MQTLNIQIALFTESKISRPDLVYAEVNKKLANIIDTMPSMIELPLDAPDDIPVVRSISSDKKYSINISRGRIDFFINGVDFIDQKNINEEDYKLINDFYRISMKNSSIFRMGVIFNYFVENNNAVEYICKKYIKEPFELDCVEISFRKNNQKLFNGKVLNNIFSIENIEINSEKRKTKGYSVLMDFNNVPEKNKIIDEKFAYNLLKMSLTNFFNEFGEFLNEK